MNVERSLLVTAVAFVGLAILLLIIQFLLRPIKERFTETGAYKNAFSIWFGGLFIVGALTISKAVILVIQTDALFRKVTAGSFWAQWMQSTATFLFVGLIWFILLYFIAQALATMVAGKRLLKQEVEGDNVGYIVLRTAMLVGVSVCLLPILDMLLYGFLPNVTFSFSH